MTTAKLDLIQAGYKGM